MRTRSPNTTGWGGPQPQITDLTAQIQSDQAKLAQTQQQLGAKLTELQTDVSQRKTVRDDAAKAVSPKVIDTFERLAEKLDGEAMSAIGKPHFRREEYVCTACNMSLVPDVYNRLHSRDELVFCPSCHRLLLIPADLPPETAINKPKERREPREKAVPATISRQTSAADISRSITPEEDEDATPEPQP